MVRISNNEKHQIVFNSWQPQPSVRGRDEVIIMDKELANVKNLDECSISAQGKTDSSQQEDEFLEEPAMLKVMQAKDGESSGRFKKFSKMLNSFKSDVRLTRATVAVILISFSFGSSVVIFPNTVYRLGPVTWTIFIAMVVVITGYCTYLNNQSCSYLLDQNKSCEILRDPYPSIAELAGGRIFRKIVTAFLYIAMITNSFSFILLSATMMNNAIPLSPFSYYNAVRIWLCIICVAVSPMMYLGSFADLKGTAIFSVTVSFIALVAVVANCIVARFLFDFKSTVNFNSGWESYKADLFVVFGLITFACAGPSYALPSILVHVPNRKEMPSTILWSFAILFAIYIFCGIIPFTVFGDKTREMITSTFSNFIESSQKGYAMAAFTNICDIATSLHLLLESVLVINPVFQLVEHALGVSRHLTWKRMLIRTSGLLIMLVICLSVPQFRPVLSIVGAVPLTLVGIIFPIFIYSAIFELSIYTKCIHFLIVLFFVIFLFGNLGVTISEIVKFLLKD